MSVRMTHPDLPDQPIEVREDALPHYQASGWQVSEEVPAPPKTTTARRRRTTGDDS